MIARRALLLALFGSIIVHSAHGQQCGNKIGSPYKGVQAFSNSGSVNAYGSCENDTEGYKRCGKGAEDGIQPNPCFYGLRYECVELVKRFYSLREDVGNQLETSTWSVEDARDYLALSNSNGQIVATSAVAGMIAFPNDGSSLPQADDVIVFDEMDANQTRQKGVGHVAIVTGVDLNSCEISVIEQNFNNTNPYGTLTLDSPCKANNHPKVQVRPGNSTTVFPVKGWLRSTNEDVLPTIQNLTTTPTPTVAGNFSINFTAAHFDPSTVQVDVTGQYCPATNPCVIHNNVLTNVTSGGFTAPASIDAGGPFNIVIQNGATGQPSAPWQLIVNNPVPSVSLLSPSSIPLSGIGQTITIDGSGFDLSSGITFNGLPHTVTFVNPNQLTFQLNLSDVTQVGQYPVIVSNPAPVGGSSLPAMLNVVNTSTNPAPSVTSLNPSSVLLNAAPTQINVLGTGFIPASTLSYKNSPHSVTYVNTNLLEMETTASDVASSGSYPIVVSNPAPGGGSSPPLNLSVSAPASSDPVIQSITTNPAPAVLGQITATVNGQYFDPNTVRAYVIGGVCQTNSACSVPGNVFYSATTGQLQVPLTIDEPAAYTLYVQNGSGNPSNGAPLPVQCSVPVLKSIATNPSPAKVGYFTVTLTGSQFNPHKMRVYITEGPCTTNSSCSVSSDSFIQKSTSSIVVPMTGSATGDFQVHAQNSTTCGSSNPLPLTINP